MNYIKRIGKSLLISFITLTIMTFLLTTFEYIGFISNSTFKIMITIIYIIIFLISGLLFGKKCNKKGWFEGIKLSLIEIIIFVILNFILTTTGINNLTIYSTILLSTTVGSIIGVNKNTRKKY